MTTQHRRERLAALAPGHIGIPAGPALTRAGLETQGVASSRKGTYDAIIVAVAHSRFVKMGSGAIRALGKPEAVLYDIKGILGKSGSDLRL